MSNNEGNEFSKGLGIIVGIAGAILGTGVANDDPDLNAFAGFIVGGLFGYIAGWVAGEFLTWIIKVILAVASVLYIVFRIYRILILLGE